MSHSSGSSSSGEQKRSNPLEPWIKDKKRPFDELLKAGENDNKASLKRVDAKYKSQNEKFVLLKASYSAQYAPLYFARLKTMRPWLKEKAEKKWKKKDIPLVPRILELKEGERCYVIGTIFKDMPLKPSVLAEYAKERAILPPPPRESYVSDGDSLILEDDTGGRVALVGASESSLPVESFVSGMVIAVKGTLVHGELEVEEICIPDLAPQQNAIQPKANSSSSSKFVALVSGLQFGRAECSRLSVQLLFDYIGGFLGSSQEQEFQSRITRVILAGNSFAESISTPIDNSNSWRANKQQKIEAGRINEAALEAMKELDRSLASLSSSVHVDIMAGATDPSNFNMPQQPMNPCLFPHSYILPSFLAVTNPYSCEIDNVSFLGTSGQPIDNIHKYMKPTSRIQSLEDTLRWRHLAPTAPDTLGCYPFENDDPFIIYSTPNVFFAGNQPEFDTKLIEGDDGQIVRLILVPEFYKTQTIVLVNLETLECHPIQFK
eukprot:TRINITY_DN14011_c0_g1_i1.p1 TRINITY_DN14011_c0_g1~~TRINITY_DN14011_c0_g1_i1.p1  ORF type:complete len:491 (+),score=111.38 TRINITY_DN14011_c0_g1_i1:187-1659(+)